MSDLISIISDIEDLTSKLVRLRSLGPDHSGDYEVATQVAIHQLNFLKKVLEDRYNRGEFRTTTTL